MILIDEIINRMDEKKDIVNELIQIDNDAMGSKISFEDYVYSFRKLNSDVKEWNLKEDILFVTEGNPIITLEILRRLDDSHNYIIFINQNYVGMNKWLVNEFISLKGYNNIRLDINLNYNNYIGLGYKVIPIGEDGMVDTVMEDFYGE